MSLRFKDLSSAELAKLPKIMKDHFSIGEERIYLHLINRKKMNWFISEYDPIKKLFFGFYENRIDGISSGFCMLEDILSYSRRGGDWEPMVDECWKPVAAKEIPLLQGYINTVKEPYDNF
jgi:hypothetical protein